MQSKYFFKVGVMYYSVKIVDLGHIKIHNDKQNDLSGNLFTVFLFIETATRARQFNKGLIYPEAKIILWLTIPFLIRHNNVQKEFQFFVHNLINTISATPNRERCQTVAKL